MPVYMSEPRVADLIHPRSLDLVTFKIYRENRSIQGTLYRLVVAFTAQHVFAMGSTKALNNTLKQLRNNVRSPIVPGISGGRISFG